MNITSKRLGKIKKINNQSKRRIHYKNKKKWSNKNMHKNMHKKKRKHSKINNKYKKTHKQKNRAYNLKNNSLKIKSKAKQVRKIKVKSNTLVQTGGDMTDEEKKKVLNIQNNQQFIAIIMMIKLAIAHGELIDERTDPGKQGRAGLIVDSLLQYAYHYDITTFYNLFEQLQPRNMENIRTAYKNKLYHLRNIFKKKKDNTYVKQFIDIIGKINVMHIPIGKEVDKNHPNLNRPEITAIVDVTDESKVSDVKDKFTNDVLIPLKDMTKDKKYRLESSESDENNENQILIDLFENFKQIEKELNKTEKRRGGDTSKKDYFDDVFEKMLRDIIENINKADGVYVPYAKFEDTTGLIEDVNKKATSVLNNKILSGRKLDETDIKKSIEFSLTSQQEENIKNNLGLGHIYFNNFVSEFNKEGGAFETYKTENKEKDKHSKLIELLSFQNNEPFQQVDKGVTTETKNYTDPKNLPEIYRLLMDTDNIQVVLKNALIDKEADGGKDDDQAKAKAKAKANFDNMIEEFETDIFEKTTYDPNKQSITYMFPAPNPHDDKAVLHPKNEETPVRSVIKSMNLDVAAQVKQTKEAVADPETEPMATSPTTPSDAPTTTNDKPDNTHLDEFITKLKTFFKEWNKTKKKSTPDESDDSGEQTGDQTGDKQTGGQTVVTNLNGQNRCWINAPLYALLFSGIWTLDKKRPDDVGPPKTQYWEIYDKLKDFKNNRTADQWTEDNWVELLKTGQGLITGKDTERFNAAINNGDYGEAMDTVNLVTTVLNEIEPDKITSYDFVDKLHSKTDVDSRFPWKEGDESVKTNYRTKHITQIQQQQKDKTKQHMLDYVKKELIEKSIHHPEIIDYLKNKKKKDTYVHIEEQIKKFIETPTGDTLTQLFEADSKTDDKQNNLIQNIIGETPWGNALSDKFYFGEGNLPKIKSDDVKLKAIIRGTSELDCNEAKSGSVGHFVSYVKSNDSPQDEDLFIEFNASKNGTHKYDHDFTEKISQIFSGEKCNFMIYIYKLPKFDYTAEQ
jgi:hypothetical protein